MKCVLPIPRAYTSGTCIQCTILFPIDSFHAGCFVKLPSYPHILSCSLQRCFQLLARFLASVRYSQGKGLNKMDSQSRTGIQGRGGTTVPGNMASRSTFRYVFVGGMVAAGIAWYASSHGYLGSAGEKLNEASRGGSKPPAGTDKVDNASSATEGTSPTGQTHTGMAQGASEGKKMK